MKQASEFVLPHNLSGNPESSTILVYLHGYPDSIRLWDPFYEPYEKENLVLRISYPNFDARLHEAWGRDFPELIKSIKETIDYAKDGKDYKVFVVSHDWGANFTYRFDKAYPNYINNGIIMDIGWETPSDLRTTLISFSYQFYLALAFLLPKGIGTAMSNLFLKVSLKEHVPYNKDDLDNSINYPYYYVHKMNLIQAAVLLIVYIMCWLTNRNLLFWAFLLLFVAYKYFTWGNNNSLAGYKPSFPLSFIYGLQKGFMFHTDNVIQYLQNKENCEVHGIEKGHWVMDNNEQFLNEMISRRLKMVITSQ